MSDDHVRRLTAFGECRSTSVNRGAREPFWVSLKGSLLFAMEIKYKVCSENHEDRDEVAVVYHRTCMLDGTVSTAVGKVL